MSDPPICACATATELDPVTVNEEPSASKRQIRIFRLELNNGVAVELCALGASITRLLLPTSSEFADDVVLGFDSVTDMYESQNPVYFGVIPGRVANRICQGCFRTVRDGRVYQLEINNEPNHLHGGVMGFSKRIWESEIIRADGNDEHEQVQFTLTSADGDQGYPGTVKVTATYSLRPTPSTHAFKLCLCMKAELLDDAPSPINLTQHSYFNLAGHNSANGILDHTLRLNCDAFTPVDDTSIPTRHVQSLDDDPVMDWRSGRLLRQALTEYGVQKAALSQEQVQTDLCRRDAPLSTTTPYGFDHNYVVRRSSANNQRNEDGEMSLVAVLQHAHRRLTIRSTQPGVQLYTANYLDGTFPATMKAPQEAASGYRRWQGLCLETQNFPDSILVDSDEHPQFATGQCAILTKDSPHYNHSVEFTFENDPSATYPAAPSISKAFHGTSSDGNHFSSVDEMWEEYGVAEGSSASWYERAASYYEENCPCTIDGVLGGFASITELDLAGSMQFIRDLESVRPAVRQWSSGDGGGVRSTKRRACECGAGLGRVTKGLLLQLSGIALCDLVESSAKLLAAAPDYLGDGAAARCRFFCSGLQDWKPAANTYSVVWIQWVLSYLTDDDIVEFLRRCGESLAEDGVIVLKENTCEESDFELDVEDASVTRSLRYWKYLIQRAGLRVFHEKMQNSFPDDFYPVPMLALEVWPQR